MADIYERGLEPARLLVDNAHLLPKGKALDVAMGNGRNAVYLARMGYEVEGVDISDNTCEGSLLLTIDSGTLFKNLIDKRIVHGSYSLARFGFSVERGESIAKKGNNSL
ncbi:MAG: hypothetical protein KKG10_00635, partial [Proteobacteria bacterium]|nr:hypothetical protein [Pseudomonadota bacterium]